RAFLIISISDNSKGLFALVDGKSVPNISASGLIEQIFFIASDGSKSILPKPVAFTLTPLSTNDRRCVKPSFDKPRWSTETAGSFSTIGAISGNLVESIYNSVCQ